MKLKTTFAAAAIAMSANVSAFDVDLYADVFISMRALAGEYICSNPAPNSAHFDVIVPRLTNEGLIAYVYDKRRNERIKVMADKFDRMPGGATITAMTNNKVSIVVQPNKTLSIVNAETKKVLVSDCYMQIDRGMDKFVGNYQCKLSDKTLIATVSTKSRPGYFTVALGKDIAHFKPVKKDDGTYVSETDVGALITVMAKDAMVIADQEDRVIIAECGRLMR